jgi:hypothetical protein
MIRAVCVAAVLSLAACSSTVAGGSTSSATVSRPVASASTLVVTDENGAVARVTVSPAFRAVRSRYTAAAPGTVLFGVRVLVRGVSGQFDVNPLAFDVVLAGGSVLGMDLGSTDSQIAAGPVTSGELVRGTVGFQVPDGSRVVGVVLRGIDRQLGQWPA